MYGNNCSVRWGWKRLLYIELSQAERTASCSFPSDFSISIHGYAISRKFRESALKPISTPIASEA